MKPRYFLIMVLLASLVLSLHTVYAHYPSRHGKNDIKIEAKKIDKGLQLTITSDDPEVAKDIQEDSRYYEEVLAYDDYCPHSRRAAYHHGCWW